MVEFLSSPFQPIFDDFINSLSKDCLICTPYITARPVQQLVETVSGKGLEDILSVKLLTDISASNLTQGATDIDALVYLGQALSKVQVVYLPRVHAKVFISDDSLALVGSANLTDGGARRNFEYGARVRQPEMVQQIRRDIEAYASLGAVVSLSSLISLVDNVHQLRQAIQEEQKVARQRLRSLSEEIKQRTEEDLIRIRVRGRSINATFTETILYLLRRGEATTATLHDAIKSIHPDLCDDEVDRVIDGKHYGKRWKHQVRSAQVSLKRQGVVEYDSEGALWRLCKK